MIDSLVLSLIRAACRAEAKRFRSGAVAGVERTQYQLLRKHLELARSTELGRQLGLSEILKHGSGPTLYRAYAERVPVAGYERIAATVGRLMKGESRLLTAEPLRILEPTSGSSGGTKLIPYTASLEREYLAGIKPWLHDLLSSFPRVRRGRWYWSVSPAGNHAVRDSAVPVGFQDDAAYTGILAGLFRQLFPVPLWVKKMRDLANFRYVTCLHLLASGRLSLISVWSPSFLTLLLQQIQRSFDALIENLESRSVTLPVVDSWDGGVIEERSGSVWVTRSRVNFLRRLASRSGSLRAVDLWPQLALVSCWTDGPSAQELPQLRELLGPVPIQQKGLLATEGIFTIPLHEVSGCVPAYRSHFMEFRAVDHSAAGRLLCVHQLEVGGTYELVVTTGAGLYRYAMGDLVRVSGRWRDLPVLEFLGRADTSDLVGEKIGPSDALRALEACGGLFLTPVRPTVGRPFYAVFYESHSPSQELAAPAIRAERELRRNFHYAHARGLGQLAPVRAYGLTRPLAELRQSAAFARGARAGDVKPAGLGSNPGDGLWLCEHGVLLEEADP